MMISRISAIFPGQDFPVSDAETSYIVDYTHQSQNARGIEWCAHCPEDIESFVVQNSLKHHITFCAFKENTIIGERKERSHCEGVIFPTQNNHETWIVLLELKYPNKIKQLPDSLKKAREQLLYTLNLFREQNIISRNQKVHLIFSAPKFSPRAPFENWCMTPAELKEIRRNQKAIMRGVNSIQILSHTALKV